MVNQFTLPTLFRAISNVENKADLESLHNPFIESLQILAANFLQSEVTPVATLRFEQDIEKTVREFARSVVEWCYGALEPDDVEAMPGSVKYRDNSEHGQNIGTVYLAAASEENQTTLSQNLTALLREIIRSHGDQLKRIAYVSDAGKVETAYWRNVLSKFYVDGVRIPMERTLDYDHASLRLTTIADW